MLGNTYLYQLISSIQMISQNYGPLFLAWSIEVYKEQWKAPLQYGDDLLEYFFLNYYKSDKQ